MHKLNGLIAATLTPMTTEGEINPTAIGQMVEFLIHNNIRGLYVCGSTGEGMSLSTAERKTITAEYVRATDGRIPVIAQVGHNSLAEARDLAAHAAACGADIISATCPSYFKAGDVKTLIECMAPIAAAASDKPFYYYHIPALTSSPINIVEFLKTAPAAIPNLAGLKYTDTKLFEFQECLAVNDGKFDIVWGCDEMLLGALVTGATAAIGSTYNLAAPLSYRVIDAFQKGDIQTARKEQLKSVLFIRSLLSFPFHGSMKEGMRLLGIETGNCRPPLRQLNADDVALFRAALLEHGIQEWGCQPCPA